MPSPRLLSLLLLSAVLAACAAPQALPGNPAALLSAPSDRDLSLAVGQSRRLPLNAGGAPASPADVVWTSSDPRVASVDLGGNVSALGPGSATLRASLRTDPSVSLSYRLSVSPAPEAGGSYERRVLELVNQARAQARSCGDQRFAAAPPLAWNSALGALSQAYSRDMAARGYFGHLTPEGQTLAERLRAAGLGDAGQPAENIAAGQPTPEAVVLNWLLSPAQCANIMNPAYLSLGVGHTQGGAYKHYWTEVFSR